MARTCAVVALTFLTVGFGASSASATCATPRGYKVAARTPQVVVLAATKRFSNRGSYACLRKTGHRTFFSEDPYAVESSPANNQAYVVSAAGDFVAFPYEFCDGGGDYCGAGIAGVNAATGVEDDHIQSVEGALGWHFHRVVVTPTGATAWSEVEAHER